MQNNRLCTAGVIALAAALAIAACASTQAPVEPGVYELTEQFVNYQNHAVDGNPIGTMNAPDGQSAWFFSQKEDEGGLWELEFTTQKTFNLLGYDYFLFDIAADNYQVLTDLSGLLMRFKDHTSSPATWVQFNFTDDLLDLFDKIGGADNFDPRQWITLRIPVSRDAGMNISANGENYNSVLRRIKSFMPLFTHVEADEFDDDPPPENSKIYVRNFRMEKR